MRRRPKDVGLHWLRRALRKSKENVEVCEESRTYPLGAAGIVMNLGDVSDNTVPKVSLLAPAKNGGRGYDAYLYSEESS